MKCPKCKLVNPAEAQRCDCGYDFESGTTERPYYRDERLAQVPNLMRQALVVLVVLNLLVALAVGLFGDPTRLIVVAGWSVVLYLLFREFKRKRKWARLAIALVTFPVGLLFFTRPYTDYLRQSPI